MARESMLTRRRHWFALLIGLVLAFVAGSGAAWVMRPKYLLTVTEEELERTPPQASAQAQFDYARGTGKERDFLAVAEYFPREKDPKNEEFIRKADLQLAYLYFDNNRLDEALQLVEPLSEQEADVSAQIRALVLHANILARHPGREQEAIGRLVTLVDVMYKSKRNSPRDRFAIWNELEKQRLKQEFSILMDEKTNPSSSNDPVNGS